MILRERINIGGIPAILWGKPSKKVYIYVHGKMSRKEYAESFAETAELKGWQTLSFDLPEHGERTDTAIPFDNYGMAENICTIALCFIMFSLLSMSAMLLAVCM